MTRTFSCAPSPSFDRRAYRTELPMQMEVSAMFQTMARSQKALISNLQTVTTID